MLYSRESMAGDAHKSGRRRNAQRSETRSRRHKNRDDYKPHRRKIREVDESSPRQKKSFCDLSPANTDSCDGVEEASPKQSKERSGHGNSVSRANSPRRAVNRDQDDKQQRNRDFHDRGVGEEELQLGSAIPENPSTSHSHDDGRLSTSGHRSVVNSRSLTKNRLARSRPSSGSSELRPVIKDNIKKQVPSSKDERRNPGFLQALFGPYPTVPEKKVACLACAADDIPISKSAKLACSHRMCHGCLRRIFVMSVKDPQHMPPRCCTSAHIPLKHVERLFSVKFKTEWNRKYKEYTTKNRLYCPSRRCGEWIKPNHIFLDKASGRKYGKCSSCKAKVCFTCNGRWHSGKECPNDEDTKRFVEIAREEGWQRCYSCSAMVELKEGCNHMTCRCTAEFCMICGSKWKTCDCPWFNYQVGDGDQLNNMDIPRARVVHANGNRDLRNQVRYQEEIERRRDQERRDEALARRLEILGVDDGDDELRGGNDHMVFNFGGPFLNMRFLNNTRLGIVNNGIEDGAVAPQRAQPAWRNGSPDHVGRPHLSPPPRRTRSSSSRALNLPNSHHSERLVPTQEVNAFSSEEARHQPLLPPGSNYETTDSDPDRDHTASSVYPWNRNPTRGRRRPAIMYSSNEPGPSGRAFIDDWRRQIVGSDESLVTP